VGNDFHRRFDERCEFGEDEEGITNTIGKEGQNRG
jgi:hypothetical protein